MGSFFEKQEVKYMGLAVAFAFIWMVFAIPFLLTSLPTSNYIVSFLIFNVAVFVLIQFVFKAIITGKLVGFKELVGILLVANSLDLWLPPYIVSREGIINGNVFLASSAADYVAGSLWASLNISGLMLYIATYVFTPIILLVVAGLLLKNFVRKI